MENTTTTSMNDPYQTINAGSKNATTNEIEKQGERTGNKITTLNAGMQKTKTTLEMVKATIIKTTDDSREKNKVINKDATINKKDKQGVRTDNTTTIIPQVKKNTTTIITPKMKKKLTIITKDDRHEKNITGDKIYQMKQTPININHDNTDNINITEKKNSYTLHSSQEPGPSKHISDRDMEEINKAIREADRVERYGKDYEQ
ncbi:hypothetical protein ACJMK2_010540 [Sinanodonta woodiana]|uniref:Uncharacterized protein n=1 Tax=Sinanodonta woodiana TaxID=1069815 RepID=A0ABD3VH28_SINWO